MNIIQKFYFDLRSLNIFFNYCRTIFLKKSINIRVQFLLIKFNCSFFSPILVIKSIFSQKTDKLFAIAAAPPK